MSGAYYNEHDPFAAEWLRRLILFGHIAEGDVDERSIEDVNPDDLNGYDQCHFFAGIGVWSRALRSAGWDDDRPVWTGSCPCQPFSAAGKGGGTADERHLWPAFFHLIGERRPGVVCGEQVASKDGLGWLDLVQADMEGAGYAFGANDLCAAGFGAPHIRQRLYFVGLDHHHAGLEGRAGRLEATGGREVEGRSVAASGAVGVVADDDGQRQQASAGRELQDVEHNAQPRRDAGRVANTESGRGGAGLRDLRSTEQRGPEPADDDGVDRPGPVNGLWRASDWLFCRDGRWRPVEPGTCPLAHGAAGRVGLLRGYGNAIVAPVAQGFIEAAMDCIP